MIRRSIRHVPGSRVLYRRLQAGWERVRPFPLPKYATHTPAIEGLGKDVRLTADTLASGATAKEHALFVAQVLDKLAPSAGLLDYAEIGAFYRRADSAFGAHWRYADLLTTVRAAATLVHADSYLEIGVFRGRSAAVVGGSRPDCEIYGFDLWPPRYVATSSPGPDFVRDELRAAGHRGKVELLSGLSQQTVPAFLHQHPRLYFDLITIDGAKTVLEVAGDFANALPRLRVGGVVVFDDLPIFPHLERVWDKVIRKDSRFVHWEFRDAEWGVAAAVRVPDEPIILTTRAEMGRAP